MAKIAVELEQALARRRARRAPGRTTPRVIARGDGWTVADVMCTRGPQDRPFEERHTHCTIAIVVAGSFQYRSPAGYGLMTPGSLMLGSRGPMLSSAAISTARAIAACRSGMRAEYFERLAADAGARGRSVGFPVSAPAANASAVAVDRARELRVLSAGPVSSWEELAVSLAVGAVRLAAGVSSDQSGVAPECRSAREPRGPGDRSPPGRGAVARNAWRAKRV